MPKEIDVYREWLGIQEPTRPLNHYQLLRLKKFEDDPVKIRDNYRKMNAHVRKFAAGDYAQQSQELLNELAKSMLCLTDARRKSEYDVGMGRKADQTGKQQTFEEILIARQIVDPEQLQKARTYAKAVGVEIRDALVQQKLVKSDVVMPAYAESIGLPFIDLADIDLDQFLIPKVPAIIARQQSCVPVMIDGDQLLMASPNVLDPAIEDELRLRIGLPVRTVLCTAGSINAVIDKHYSRETMAAEMAAGPTPSSNAPAAAAPTAKAEKKPAKAVTPDSPEAKKQRRLIGFMTFNFTFMAIMIALTSFMDFGLMKALAVAFPAAGAVGGIVFGIVSAMRK